MDFSKLRQQMVKKQIQKRGINDPKIIDAFLKVPRHEFVSEKKQYDSYSDYPLNIGYNQTISQPYIVAEMLNLLNLKSDDTLLEVGSGCGYASAIASLIVKHVYGLEIIDALYKKSKETIDQLGYENITFVQKDGKKGLPEKAPFDKILISAAADELPQPLLDQLAVNGILVAPVNEHRSQRLVKVTKNVDGSFDRQNIMAVRFVPLS